MTAVVAIVADAGDSIAEAAEIAADIITTATVGIIVVTILADTRHSGALN